MRAGVRMRSALQMLDSPPLAPTAAFGAQCHENACGLMAWQSRAEARGESAIRPLPTRRLDVAAEC